MLQAGTTNSSSPARLGRPYPDPGNRAQFTKTCFETRPIKVFLDRVSGRPEVLGVGRPLAEFLLPAHEGGRGTHRREQTLGGGHPGSRKRFCRGVQGSPRARVLLEWPQRHLPWKSPWSGTHSKRLSDRGGHQDVCTSRSMQTSLAQRSHPQEAMLSQSYLCKWNLPTWQIL